MRSPSGDHAACSDEALQVGDLLRLCVQSGYIEVVLAVLAAVTFKEERSESGDHRGSLAVQSVPMSICSEPSPRASLTMIRLALPCSRTVQARCFPSGESDVCPRFRALPRSARIARTFGFAGGWVSVAFAATAAKGTARKQSRKGRVRRHKKLMGCMLTAFRAR